MGQKVKITGRVRNKLDKLENVLFKKEYHGFRDSSKKYVENIIAFIYTIPDLKHHPTKNTELGTWFVRYQPNNKTTYYIIFDIRENRFLVNGLITNHEKAYKKIFGIG